MIKVISIFLLAFSTKISFTQTSAIVGAWYWRDAKTATSIFFQDDGTLSMHSGPKDGVILDENLKNGTYTLTKNLLTIKWANNNTENYNIKFLDKNSFKLIAIKPSEKQKKTGLIFRRVLDEEVIE